jgi:hypothetical protein
VVNNIIIGIGKIFAKCTENEIKLLKMVYIKSDALENE